METIPTHDYPRTPSHTRNDCQATCQCANVNLIYNANVMQHATCYMHSHANKHSMLQCHAIYETMFSNTRVKRESRARRT